MLCTPQLHADACDGQSEQPDQTDQTESESCSPTVVELAPMSVTTLRSVQNRSAARTTASHSVLDRTVDSNRPAPHVSRLLNTLPGVSVQRGSGQEYLPAIRSAVLSGPGACAGFLMAEDGIPLRASGFCNLNELFDAHSEAAGQIDVIRGPAGVAYGSNALQGLVNVVTAQPTAGINSITGRTRVTVGSDDYLKGYGRLEFSSEQHALGIHLTAMSDGGFRAHSPVAQHKLSLRGESAVNELQWSYGMTVTELNQETAGFLQGPDAYRDLERVRDNDTPEAFRDAKALRMWLRVNNVASLIDPRSVQWSQTVYLRRNRMDFLQHFLPGDPLETNGHDSLGIQSRIQGIMGPKLNWQLGGEFEWTDGRLAERQDQPTAGSAFLRETIPTGQHYDYQVDAISTGVFARLLHDSSRGPDLSAGLRLDHIRYDYDNRMLNGRTREDGTECGFGGCRFSRPADRDDQFTELTMDLGLHGEFDDHHRWHAGLSRAFRAPQATELYRLQREQQVADLDSEELINLEAGISSNQSTLTWSLVGYLQRKRQSIFRDSDFFNVSNGKTRHRGLEMEVSVRFSPSLALRGTWTVARHEYDQNLVLGDIDIRGNRVDTAPSQFGTLSLRWQPHDDWTSELSLQSMGSYKTDPENLNDYPGHELLDLSVNYTATPRMMIRADVNNLLDERYADRADFSTFSGDRYFPGRPRHWFVGLDYRW